MILGVDPGASTGWTLWNDVYVPAGRGIERGVDNFANWMSDCAPCDIIVYEDFRLFGHKAIAQVGSRMEASQVIGILKLKAHEWNAKMVPQKPQCYKLGEMWSGKKVGAHADSHDLVAFNHVFYYLVTHGLMTAKKHKLINIKE